MQKVRGRTHKVLPLLVDTRFQILFTPLAGVLFTFPSRYLCTIGHRGILRLGRWSSHVQTGFLVSRPTRGLPRAVLAFVYGAVTLFGAPSQALLLASTVSHRGPHPAKLPRRFGLVRVRSPLLAESLLISFPPGT